MANILCIESDDIFLRFVLDCLSSKGFDAVGTQESEKGLELLVQNPIKLIFCDYMPLSKREFVSTVKTDPEFRQYSSIPIVGLSDFPQDLVGFLVEEHKKPVNNYKAIVSPAEKYLGHQ
jgi:CheY-like chemotaxis protein